MRNFIWRGGYDINKINKMDYLMWFNLRSWLK